MTTKDRTNYVTNTTAQTEENPVATLLDVMGGGIEASEARGQAQLVRSEVLPTNMGNQQSHDLLRSWGFEFGGPVDGDPIFTHAKLPAGWKKVATDHAMWSRILDEQGRERCAIFYKAAFYDRSARLNITARFRDSIEYESGGRNGRLRGVVTDAGRLVFAGDWQTPDKDWKGYDAATAESRQYLAANYPTDIAEQWTRP